MKRLFSVLLFLVLILAAFVGIVNFAEKEAEQKRLSRIPSETVTVYTDMPSGVLETLGKFFYIERGIKMNVVYMSSSMLLQGANAQNPPDVYITSQENLIKLKKLHKLKEYSSSETDITLNLFKDNEYYWTGLWIDPVIFSVNRDFYTLHPAFSYTWEEVFYRKFIRLSMTDFIAADMAEDLLMCLAEHFGIQESLEMLRIAQMHIVQYGKYLSTPSRLAAMSKSDIGISSYNEAMRTKSENMPLTIIYPEDGTAWYLYGEGMSASSTQPDKAQILLDWLLTAYRFKEDLRQIQFFYLHVNDKEAAPDVAGNKLVFWPLEKNYFDEGKKDLLTQWGEKIRFGG